MTGKNPYEFKPGQIVECIFSGEKWEILVSDSGGMARLKKLESGYEQVFNAYSNPHFKETTLQLTLF